MMGFDHEAYAAAGGGTGYTLPGDPLTIRDKLDGVYPVRVATVHHARVEAVSLETEDDYLTLMIECRDCVRGDKPLRWGFLQDSHQNLERLELECAVHNRAQVRPPEAIVSYEETWAALETYREWAEKASEIDAMWWVLKTDRERGK